MSEPGDLGPVQQHELLDELAEVVLASTPDDIQVIAIEYICLGRYVELRVGVEDSNGEQIAWDPPAEVDHLFWRLRVGMFVEGLGTWFSAFFRIRPPGPYEVFYNRDNEPPWNPSAKHFVEEQELFPRNDIHQPDWFCQQLVAADANPAAVAVSTVGDAHDRQADHSMAAGDDLVGQACALLARNSPSDWATIVLNYRASSTVCQAEITATAHDGRQLLVAPPEGMDEMLRDLRASMADDTDGAWLSVRFTLVADAEPSVDFNYMHDPIWTPPVDPSVFDRDLQDFPRHPSRVPEWLREQVTSFTATSTSQPPETCSLRAAE